MRTYPVPKAPSGSIVSRNPVVNGAIIFVAALGGIMGARATSRWIDRVAPKLSSRISLGITTAQAVSGMLDDDDDESED